MRVYLSGRIKDYPAHEEHFAKATEFLAKNTNHTPVSPLDLLFAEGASYEDFMREDLRVLLDCEAIYMLEGWERSAGSRCEHHVAAMIGLTFFYEVDLR